MSELDQSLVRVDVGLELKSEMSARAEVGAEWMWDDLGSHELSWMGAGWSDALLLRTSVESSADYH